MSAIEDSVCVKIKQRAEVGEAKYGTTMEREDFTELDWLVYAQEEALDFVVYLERLIQDKRLADENDLEARLRELIANRPHYTITVPISQLEKLLDEVSE